MSYRGPVTYRVIQWATGNVGKSAIEGVLAHPELELVGVKVYGSDKDGVDAGEICGIDPIGVAATTDDDAVLALDADCVVYTPVLANRDEVRSILASGKNVVTPVGWLYPFVADRVLGHVEDEPILRAAIDGGVTLHGTGIHPGGITERFPLMVSALVSDVRHVRAEEFSDIRSYAAEFVVREIMMFGKSPEETAHQFDEQSSWAGTSASRSPCSPRSWASISTPTSRPITRWAVATAPIDSPVGVIDPGHRRGAALHVDRHRRRRGGDHRRGELADGGGAPRPPVDVRRRATVRGRPSSETPRSTSRSGTAAGEAGRRPRSEPGHRRDRHALRERGSLRVRRPRRESRPTSTFP